MYLNILQYAKCQMMQKIYLSNTIENKILKVKLSTLIYSLFLSREKFFSF